MEDEIGRGGGIDQPQAHPLAGLGILEQSQGPLPVGQKCIVADIRQVHATHADPAVLPPRIECITFNVSRKADDGVLLARVVVTVLLQVVQDLLRILVGPVLQDDHGLAQLLWACGARFDDDAAMNPGLLLQVGVRVVPVGTRLAQGNS